MCNSFFLSWGVDVTPHVSSYEGREAAAEPAPLANMQVLF